MLGTPLRFTPKANRTRVRLPCILCEWLCGGGDKDERAAYPFSLRDYILKKRAPVQSVETLSHPLSLGNEWMLELGPGPKQMSADVLSIKTSAQKDRERMLPSCLDKIPAWRGEVGMRGIGN